MVKGFVIFHQNQKEKLIRKEMNSNSSGVIKVEKVGDKSTVTTSFSKYPLKFIIPNKVGPSQIDAVWIYSITYGGGVVSGDCIRCEITVGDGCTSVLTTQASTKVYKSVGSKYSEQVLEARVGSNAFFALIPDPVTCFATANYSQLQVFNVMSDSNLLIVDWITSGRRERGEKWDFDVYKSTNRIFLEDDEPLFLDSVLLQKEGSPSLAERMHDYQVLAMVVLFGPKLKQVQNRIQEDVKRLMTQQLHFPSVSTVNSSKSHNHLPMTKPKLIASCSVFGRKGTGVVVRIAAMTTESVYSFLQNELAGLEVLLGIPPYK